MPHARQCSHAVQLLGGISEHLSARSKEIVILEQYQPENYREHVRTRLQCAHTVVCRHCPHLDDTVHASVFDRVSGLRQGSAQHQRRRPVAAHCRFVPEAVREESGQSDSVVARRTRDRSVLG